MFAIPDRTAIELKLCFIFLFFATAESHDCACDQASQRQRCDHKG